MRRTGGWIGELRKLTWAQQPDYNLDGAEYIRKYGSGSQEPEYKRQSYEKYNGKRKRANAFNGDRDSMVAQGCETHTGSKEAYSEDWEKVQDDEIRCCYYYKFDNLFVQ